jgi:NAD(P)-dependent dehydrogenase (short-subunit alcohol dehydrogenase family)
MKTALVTGATDGIGQETARQLVALGWRVLVHGRNPQRAESALHTIAGDRGRAQVEPVWGDLSRMPEAVLLAAQVKERAPTLDVLINNAGVYEPRRHLTDEGFELTMAVNHFAPFLLTHHLLSAVSRAPAGRIVTVSSMTHQSGSLDLDDLSFSHRYDGYAAYSTSKLANVLFTLELARRLEGTRVTANCLHPGVIATKLLRRGFGMGGAPVTEGARTSVYLATSPEVARVSARYFVDCRQATPSRSARDAALAARLWEESERLLAAFL